MKNYEMHIGIPNLTSVDISVIQENIIGLKGRSILTEYEYEFIRRITSINLDKVVEDARNYFLSDYSSPILEYIGRNICHQEGSNILGEYYEFISRENFEKKIPYYKLTLFSAKNGAHLNTYVSTITSRHFCNLQNKKKKETRLFTSTDDEKKTKLVFSEDNLIECSWFHLLLCEGTDYDFAYDEELALEKIRDAICQLPKREQLVIQLMVMDKLSGLDAFEELAEYLKPKKAPLDEWGDKQKQNAMALLKARALKHLKQIIER